MHHHTENEEKLSICEAFPRLDLVSFLVLNRIKLQAPLLEVHGVQEKEEVEEDREGQVEVESGE